MSLTKLAIIEENNRKHYTFFNHWHKLFLMRFEMWDVAEYSLKGTSPMFGKLNSLCLTRKMVKMISYPYNGYLYLGTFFNRERMFGFLIIRYIEENLQITDDGYIIKDCCSIGFDEETKFWVCRGMDYRKSNLFIMRNHLLPILMGEDIVKIVEYLFRYCDRYGI